MKNIVIFASGGGSNAEAIMKHFQGKEGYTIAGIFTNNANAGVLQKAETYGVPTVTFNREELNGSAVLLKLQAFNPDLIVLAGFLWKFPSNIITAYPDKIINIHPALLPNYGGKGMYGIHVHTAVYTNKDKESGITIHYVNEHYDEGNIIFQASVALDDCTTPNDIAAKVLQLEHKFLPTVIEDLLKADGSTAR
ncbi:MAG: phosphoribosylglycinamide formyltransferase [Flavobacterium sp.]